MAHLVQFTHEDGSTIALPSVTHHVSSRVNSRQREDVILVQALCQIIFDGAGLLKSPLKHPVRVTGFFGPETDKLVKKFEREQMSRLRPSGLVSPARPTSFGKASLTWTIIQMAFIAGEALPGGFDNNSNSALLTALRKFPELNGPLDGDIVVVP